jgi:hypothetical protein
LDSSSDISESKLWFALYHPKVPPIYFHWIFTVYYPEMCILLFNCFQFSVATY